MEKQNNFIIWKNRKYRIKKPLLSIRNKWIEIIGRIAKLKEHKIFKFLKDKYILIGSPAFFALVAFTSITESIGFVPDYLNLSEVISKDFFGLIIGAIASIFGILMAVILLTVEFFKERLNKNKHTNPLENKLIRNSIYNSVNLIGLSFIAFILFDSFNTSKSLTIGYFLGIIFIAYIYSVYPVLKKIIGKSSRIKENIDSVASLDLNSFQNHSRYKTAKGLIVDNKLKVLVSEMDSYILNNNILAYQKINEGIMLKVFDLLGDGRIRQKCDIFITALTSIWRENIKTAIRVSDGNYFEMIWGNIKDIYIYFSNKKAPLLNIMDMHFFIMFDFLKFHIKLENSMPLNKAIDVIEVSFKENLLNNCPKQEDIIDLVSMYEKDEEEFSTSFDDSTQWREINSVFGLLQNIKETAIALTDKDLFKECNRRINSICRDIVWNDFKLGKYQLSSIIREELTSSFYYSNLALKAEMYPKTEGCFKIPKNFINELIKHNIIDERDLRMIMTNLGDYLILAFKEKKLSTDLHYGTLQEFCLIGIYSLKIYKTNKLAKMTVNYIINVLNYLKKYSEKNHLSEYSNEYLKLKSKLNHFIKVAVDMNDFEETKKPVKKWKSICDDFKKLSKVKDFGIVKWKVE